MLADLAGTTLFPGLSGFSESLRTWLAFFPEEDKVLTGHSEDVMKYLYSKEKLKFYHCETMSDLLQLF